MTQVHGPFRLRVPGPAGPPPQRPALPDYTGTYRRCEHPTTRLVRFRQSNDVWVARLQCVVCGYATQNVPKASAADFDALPVFDEALKQRWNDGHANRQEAVRAAHEAAEAKYRSDWGVWYARYLESPGWKARRAAVLERDGHWCQGCRAAPATEVHHLTYVHVGDELLFELVAVCRGCHEKAHARKDA